MLNIRPKLFDNGSPVHHPLSFNQGCGIGRILLYENTFILLVKENSSELLKAFHHHEKFLISHGVVTLWLAPYY